MATQAQEQEQEHGQGKDKKVTLTITTLEGDYTHDFPEHQKLTTVIEQTVDKLELKGDGPWILEKDDVELNAELTIAEAKLKDGDVLTLNPEEGGGGSERL
jgi:predicted RNase H-like nuclease (RuvC/YqgF family)